MSKLHAIQKAKRKRQHRRHRNRPITHPRTDNKPFDASILLIHGIGNQKPSTLINKWGDSIVEEIKNLSSQKGWSFETNTSADTKVVSLRKNENSYTISLSECVWSDKFERPGRREMLSWIIGRLPAFLFLLLPDSREAEHLFDGSKNIMGTRLAVHFMIRFLLFTGITSWTLWSIYTISQWAATRASHSEAEFIALAVLTMITTVLAVKFHSNWNLAGHVKVVSELNSEEAEKITRFVQSKIEDTHFQSHSTTVVAHSQGGLLAHDALTHITSKSASQLRLFGVGSGIRPITLFRSLRRWPGILYLWSWFLFVISMLPLLQFLLYIPYFPHFLFVMLRLSLLVNLTFLTAQAIPPTVWSNELSQLQYPRVSDVFNLSSIPPILVAFFLISIIGLIFSIRKMKAGVQHIKDIPDIDWIEVTTPHDIVGRFAFPILPSKVKQITVPLEGNPILDHTRYFKKGSLVPRIIAAATLNDLGVLSKEDALTRYELVSNSALELTRKRWRLVSFVSLTLTCPFIFAITIFPPSILLLIFTSMLFCAVSVPLRFGQYILNHIKQRVDIENATRNNYALTRSTSEPPYLTVIPLLTSSGIGFLGGLEWIFLIKADYIPVTFTPFLLLLTSLAHFIWAASLASRYKPSSVALVLVSAMPLLCLLFIDKAILWPEILPIGLLHSSLLLAVSIFVWATPCLRMFRTAKRADPASGT